MAKKAITQKNYRHAARIRTARKFFQDFFLNSGGSPTGVKQLYSKTKTTSQFNIGPVGTLPSPRVCSLGSGDLYIGITTDPRHSGDPYNP